MRKSFLTLTILMVAALPALADIGTVSLLLQSSHDNSTLDQNTAIGIIDYGPNAIPLTIPVSVRFSATTSGVDGGNSGVFGLYANLTGSALAAQTTKMTQNAIFKAAMGTLTITTDTYSVTHQKYSGPVGMGFDAVVDLGSTVPGPQGEGVYGFGASQVTSAGSEDFGNADAQYTGHPYGSHTVVNHGSRTNVDPPLLASTEAYQRSQTNAPSVASTTNGILAFTGTLNLLGTNNAGVINLAGSASLWAAGGGATASAGTSGSSLIILPEPTTIGLLAPLALFLVRRRRA